MPTETRQTEKGTEMAACNCRQLIAVYTLKDGFGNIEKLRLYAGKGRSLVASLASAGGTPLAWSNLQAKKSLPAFWSTDIQNDLAEIVHVVLASSLAKVQGCEVSPELPEWGI